MFPKIRAPFFIFVLTFCLFGFFSLFLIDPLHDAVVVIPAVEVSHGKVLFREVFTQYGALFTFTQALALKLLGIHIYTIRFVTLLFYSGTAVVLWSIYRRFLPFKWNLLAFLLWLGLSPVYWWYFHSWSSVPAAFFQCLSLLFFLWYVEKPKNSFLVYSGIASVISFWFRQPVGAVNIAVISVGFLILLVTKTYRKKTCISALLSFYLGVIIGFLPLFVWLVKNNALYDWWLQSIVMEIPFVRTVRGTSASQVVKSLLILRYRRQIFTHGIWLVIPLSAIGLTMYATKKLFQKKIKNNYTIQLLFVGLVGIGSWHQYYPTVELLHFYWACIPMIGLFVTGIYLGLKRYKPLQMTRTLSLLLVVVCCLLVIDLFGGFKRISVAQYTTNVLPFLSGIPITKADKEFYEDVVSKLNIVFAQYPQKTFINDSGNAIYPLFSPPHFISFHGIFADWDFITSTADPTMQQNKKNYIDTEQPLIFTRYVERYPEYCDLGVKSLDDPAIRLLIPKELSVPSLKITCP